MSREERGLEGSTASDDSIEKGVFFWGGVRGQGCASICRSCRFSLAWLALAMPWYLGITRPNPANCSLGPLSLLLQLTSGGGVPFVSHSRFYVL